MQNILITDYSSKNFNGNLVEASAAFIRSEGEYLFLRRTQHLAGGWSNPGGKLLKDENPRQALLREILEETGIEIPQNQQMSEPVTYLIKNTWGDFILHTYFINLNYRPKVILNEEHDNYCWLSWENARKTIDLIPGHIYPDVFEAERSRIQNRDMLVKQLQTLELGLKRKAVELFSYNANWVLGYSMIGPLILKAIPELEILEHIGSTSIPGAMAKPIIDILAVLPTREKIFERIHDFEQLGFVYKGDGVASITDGIPDPDRHFFAFYDSEHKMDYIHLHLVPSDSVEIEAKLHFRNRLRGNSHLVKEYNDLKCNLHNGGVDRKMYTNSKTHFIAKVLNHPSNMP